MEVWFGRWFSLSIGWFLGSMLIFQGVIVLKHCSRKHHLRLWESSLITSTKSADEFQFMFHQSKYRILPKKQQKLLASSWFILAISDGFAISLVSVTLDEPQVLPPSGAGAMTNEYLGWCGERCVKDIYIQYRTGWWFQILFFTKSTWGNDPIWRAYFSNGWFNHQLENYENMLCFFSRWVTSI